MSRRSDGRLRLDFDLSDVRQPSALLAPRTIFERRICECGILLAECVLPHGDGSVALCWVCAHDYTEHGAEPGTRSGVSCGCSAVDIYPADVIAARS